MSNDVFTIGDKQYKFVHDSGIGTCDKCVFHKKPNSCKASDLFDSGVLPQCDADGIGEGYFIKYDGIDILNKHLPGICPNCGSVDVDFGDTEYGGEECWQDCGCQECGTKWFEIYKFDRKAIV
jgi:hypothetical protein